MRITKQARREAKDLFHGCQLAGRLDEARVRQVVQHVIERKPRGYYAILKYLQRLVKLDLDRRTARVENAIESSPAFQATVLASLERRYGAGLSVTFATNPDLIAGLRVKVGSDVYDGSIHGRLAALQSSL